jgi:hypothetical protein
MKTHNASGAEILRARRAWHQSLGSALMALHGGSAAIALRTLRGTRYAQQTLLPLAEAHRASHPNQPSLLASTPPAARLEPPELCARCGQALSLLVAPAWRCRCAETP